MIDMSDPALDERLRRRTSEGQYEISESELVVNIRRLRAAENREGGRHLAEVLLSRCTPSFQYYTFGLMQRPDLREEAIANMSEHLLREAQDPSEQFITQNFFHYLRCLCVDEFNRLLRREGLHYRRDEEGQPLGRPTRVPQALVESLRPPDVTKDNWPPADVADPHDQYEQFHSYEESTRMLMYLHDQLDRKVMILRALEGMKWEEIARICQRTERTVRLRYERARSILRERLSREEHTIYPIHHPAG